MSENLNSSEIHQNEDSNICLNSSIVSNSSENYSISDENVDKQISTAKRFKRDPKACLFNAISIATLSVEIAESCIYKKPQKVKDPDSGKWIDGFLEGESVRLTEILATTWGNLRISSWPLGIFEKSVRSAAVVWDLESNVQYSLQEDRSIFSSKTNQFFNHDLIVTTSKACSAICRRNALLSAIPRSVAEAVVFSVRAYLAESYKNGIKEKAEKFLKRFEQRGISRQNIFILIGKNNVDEIDENDVVDLLALGNSLTSGISTKEDFLNVENIEQKDEKKPRSKYLLEKIKAA